MKTYYVSQFKNEVSLHTEEEFLNAHPASFSNEIIHEKQFKNDEIANKWFDLERRIQRQLAIPNLNTLSERIEVMEEIESLRNAQEELLIS